MSSVPFFVVVVQCYVLQLSQAFLSACSRLGSPTVELRSLLLLLYSSQGCLQCQPTSGSYFDPCCAWKGMPRWAGVSNIGLSNPFAVEVVPFWYSQQYKELVRAQLCL